MKINYIKNEKNIFQNIFQHNVPNNWKKEIISSNHETQKKIEACKKRINIFKTENEIYKKIFGIDIQKIHSNIIRIIFFNFEKTYCDIKIENNKIMSFLISS